MRRKRPCASASFSVMRCNEPGRARSRKSRQSEAKGLASPLWVLMTCARPPQTRKASAALSTSPRSSTKAASSTMARSPGLPLERKARGAEVMARISRPEAKAMRKVWMPRPSFTRVSPQVSRRELQLPRPAGAVLDEAPGHLPVVGLVVDVAAAAACVQHRVVGLGPGDADATRLLDHLQPGTVLNPAVLIGEEGGEVWKRVGVGAGHARNMARPGAGSHRTNVRGVQARASRRVIV